MGLFKIIIPLILFAAPLASSETSTILYLIQSGSVAPAIEQYTKYYQKRGSHDFELLQRIGIALLEQGSKSKDPETLLITLFGAGVTMNESVQYILENALQNQDPRIQLIALSLLKKFQNDDAIESITRTLSSPYLLIRAEAILYLAEKKHPKALGCIDSLMQKVPAEVLPVFPVLYATLGTKSAIKSLQRLMLNPNQDVRIEVVLNAAKFERDDLLPAIRQLANHHNTAAQEACAVAFGTLKDESSVNKLNEWMKSGTPSLRLAALQALYKLSRDDARKGVEELAKQENTFAVYLLGSMPGSEPVLRTLLASSNIHVRINAALALLELRDSACWPSLKEILVIDSRGLAFVKIQSEGKGLTAWKVIPSASHQLSDIGGIEQSLPFKETILEKSLALPKDTFFQIANTIFNTRQDELVPAITLMLQNLQTPEAIALLKKYREQVGAPLIRTYCNLALFKLNEEGPYEEALLTWISSQMMNHLINFKEQSSPKKITETTPHQLSPEETSRLLIDAFESYTQRRTEQGINLLLHAIQYGNSKNRYALAGLLILATE